MQNNGLVAAMDARSLGKGYAELSIEEGGVFHLLCIHDDNDADDDNDGTMTQISCSRSLRGACGLETMHFVSTICSKRRSCKYNLEI